MILKLQYFATNTTASVGLTDEMKTFYEKRLIDLAEPKLVHAQFADKYQIPRNGGRQIEFRKYSPLKKALKPLEEGVTPAGNSLTVSTVTASLSQYGDWIGLSDMLEMTAIDNNVVQATRLLGSQAGRTLDTVLREELNGGTNVFYAPKISGETVTEVTARHQLDATAKLTPDMIFKAAALLKTMNADPVDDCFVAIIHPYVAYDFMRSPEWIDVSKYAKASNIYSGEIGKLAGVRFVETSEAKVWKGVPLTAASANLSVRTAISAATKVVAVKEAITAAEAAALGGRDVIIGGTLYEIETATAGVANAASITLVDSIASAAVNDMVYPGEAGAANAAVFSTLILGAHSYGDTELEGGGLNHIVKQLGYADELNQRSACGWKAAKAARRLVEEYMVRIESCSTFSPTAEAN